MSFQVMISQLGSGMMTTIQIFLLTLIFSLPLGLLVAFGRMSKKCCDKNDHQNIYFHYAWNTLNATAFGGIFWTILYFRREYFVKLPRICGCDRICKSTMLHILQRYTVVVLSPCRLDSMRRQKY